MTPDAYSKAYQDKRIDPQDAAAMIASGMAIHLGGGANVAAIIDKYLARRKDDLEDVTVHTFIDTHPYDILLADPRGEVFKWYSDVVLPATAGAGSIHRPRGIGPRISFIINTHSTCCFW